MAGIGFNFNQDAGTDGGTTSALGTINIGNSITVSVTKSGSLLGNSALRVQLTDANNKFYCYGGQVQSGVPIPISQFNTTCWNNMGESATSSMLFKRVDVQVTGSVSTDEPFAFCLTNVSVE